MFALLNVAFLERRISRVQRALYLRFGGSFAASDAVNIVQQERFKGMDQRIDMFTMDIESLTTWGIEPPPD